MKNSNRSDEKAIRNQYSKLGVDDYYRKHGAEYVNPHFPYIQKLLLQNQERIDYERVFDFCCGGGEVTSVLQALGFSGMTGSDPYTQKAFLKNTGLKAMDFSFDDIIRGKLSGSWSSIICSFAMHLCPEGQLFPLVYQLFQHSPQLIIITPHKRPQLERLDGVQLDFTDFCFTPKGKKVFLKRYRWGVDTDD